MVATFFSRAKDLFGVPTPPAAGAKPAVVAKKINPFHAVSIDVGPRCCPAARKLEGKRFLSKDAPILPLKDCGRADCTCRYAHHEDRRSGPRRARDMGVAIDGYVEEERRSPPKRGRRKSDQRS